LIKITLTEKLRSFEILGIFVTIHFTVFYLPLSYQKF